MKTVFENELVQIIHGDVFDVCADQICILAVDLAFCDPPFNIGQNYGDEVSDRIEPDRYNIWLKEMSTAVYATIRSAGVLWLHGPDDLAFQWLSWIGSLTPHRVAWVNLYYGFGQAKKTSWIDARCHGLAFCDDPYSMTWNPDDVLIETERRKQNDKRVRGRSDVGWRVPGTIWGIPEIDGPNWGRVQGNNKERVKGRPNQLPEKYLERIIKAYTNPGDLIFDPFCGTGTTAVVAAALGRRCITSDLSIEACELAAERVQRGAVRVSSTLSVKKELSP